MKYRVAFFIGLTIITAIIIFIVTATILKTGEPTRDFILSLVASSILWYSAIKLNDRDEN